MFNTKETIFDAVLQRDTLKNAYYQDITTPSDSVVNIHNGYLIIMMLLSKINDFKQQERAQSEFFLHMSHELRSPLNSIINFNKFVIRRDLGQINHAQEEALQQSIQSAEHLLTLINNVLDIAKIEASMMRLFIEDNISIQKQPQTQYRQTRRIQRS